MLRINYPNIPGELKLFKEDYLCAVNGTAINEELKVLLRNPKFRFLGKNIAHTILTSPIKQLFIISEKINRLTSTKQKSSLRQILNYTSNSRGQPKIADFFMKHAETLGLSTCYYCNIDYINTFKHNEDYENGLDFVKRADKKQLTSISLITPSDADNIIKQRARINSISTLNLSSLKIHNLQTMNFKKKYSHFTLDHFLSKEKHPLLALSLFNLVPCCYACNSKFKGRKEIVKKRGKTYLSPTSEEFSFHNDVMFKVLFKQNPKNEIRDVASVDNFVLGFDFAKNSKDHEVYCDAFKLRARYVFHKKEVVRLVDKRKRYSDSQIKEISKLLKIDASKIKQDIYGSELYTTKLEEAPLTKLKKDIGLKLGIIKK